MIFIDRSIPKGVADALKAVRDDVKWLEDEFPHDIKEPDWLRDVGAWGWLVICRDKKIRTRPGERRALMENGVGCFVLTQRDSPKRWDYLKLLAKTLDEMERIFATTERPFLYGVSREGGFTRII
jgi:hypothetical protein